MSLIVAVVYGAILFAVGMGFIRHHRTINIHPNHEGCKTGDTKTLNQLHGDESKDRKVAMAGF